MLEFIPVLLVALAFLAPLLAIFHWPPSTVAWLSKLERHLPLKDRYLAVFAGCGVPPVLLLVALVMLMWLRYVR